MQELHQIASQTLCADVALHQDRVRHGYTTTMHYDVLRPEEEVEETEEQTAEDILFSVPTVSNPEAHEPALTTAAGEPCGVAHLVHGWIQRGNLQKASPFL